MKRVFFLILALMLLLSGCGGQKPLPEDWDASWTVVSDRLAAEPLEGFELKEINTALAVSGIYYATWASGEAREHVNEEGEEAQIFDAQVYVLSQDFRNAEAARKEASGWTERAGTIYQVGEPEILTLNGQEFTLLPLLSGHPRQREAGISGRFLPLPGRSPVRIFIIEIAVVIGLSGQFAGRQVFNFSQTRPVNV